MRLGFDQYGDVQVAEVCVDTSFSEKVTYKTETACTAAGYTWVNKLENLPEGDALISRFHMFFSTQRGWYNYKRNFGINSDFLFGKIYLEEIDLQNFSESVSRAILTSDLADTAEVSTTKLDRHTLEVSIDIDGEDASWKYSLTNGRLSKIQEVNNAEDTTDQATAVSFISVTEQTIYDVSPIFEKCNALNNIQENQDVSYSYRILAVDSNRATTGTLLTGYVIDDFNWILKLEEPASLGSWLRVEVWPSSHANLEIATNPYLLRNR